MKLQPLQQCAGIHRRAIHQEASVLRRDRHTLGFEHGGQRSKPCLLFLFRSRIAKQVQSAREQRGDVLRGGHGEAESIEYPP